MQANNSPAAARSGVAVRRAAVRGASSGVLSRARRFALALAFGCSAAAAAVDPSVLDQGSDIAYRRVLTAAATARKLNADADLTARVRRIAQPLLAAAPAVDPSTRSYAWSINVVTDATPSVVVYPRGRILVNDSLVAASGLVDDELAAILAHGIAHSVLGHDTSRIVARAGAALDASDPNKRALALADAIADTVKGVRYTADENQAADRAMIDMMARAAFDPRAAGSGWRRVRSVRAIVDRSPVTDERLAAIDAAAREAVGLYDESRARKASQPPSIRLPQGTPQRSSPR